MSHTFRDTLNKRSKGVCRPTESNQTIRGVYDSLDVPAGVTGLYFYEMVVLGDITVRGRARGTIYRPNDVTDFANLGKGNDDLHAVRKPWSELVQISGRA